MTGDRSAFFESVSRETMSLLNEYEALLKKWNPAINLVASSTISELWDRHFLDSAQLLSHAPSTATSWVDIGTGGGFPGLVVAIFAKETRHDLAITCIESDLRKATFLRTVIRELNLNAKVISERIESVDPQNADVLSARALASLSQLMEFSERHLSKEGVALFLKGENWQYEIDEAEKKWCFEHQAITSKTHQDAAILKIGNISRA